MYIAKFSEHTNKKILFPERNTIYMSIYLSSYLSNQWLYPYLRLLDRPFQITKWLPTFRLKVRVFLNRTWLNHMEMWLFQKIWISFHVSRWWNIGRFNYFLVPEPGNFWMYYGLSEVRDSPSWDKSSLRQYILFW